MADISEKAWASAAAEFSSPSRDQGLWAREFAKADGDENKAKAAYLRIRAAAFFSEESGQFARPQNESHTHAIAVRKTSKLTWFIAIVGGLIIAFFVIGIIAGNSPEAEARGTERRAIAMCWDNQTKKSLDPAAARFIAGACERMENDFRAKHRMNP